MYLKICFLILLLFPYVQKKPKAPVCAVEGQWQLDKVRSPDERKENLVWTIGLTTNRVTWIEEHTKEGVIESRKHTYPVGKNTWRESDSRWETHAEFDENRLIIRWRRNSRSKPLPDWNVHEFEVKDHGYTLYYKLTYGRDVVIRENALYFRPVPKKKK